MYNTCAHSACSSVLLCRLSYGTLCPWADPAYRYSTCGPQSQQLICCSMRYGLTTLFVGHSTELYQSLHCMLITLSQNMCAASQSELSNLQCMHQVQGHSRVGPYRGRPEGRAAWEPHMPCAISHRNLCNRPTKHLQDNDADLASLLPEPRYLP